MNILDTAIQRMTANGFRIATLSDRQVIFEDASVLGIVVVFTSPQDLLSTWMSVQDQFLRSHANEFQKDKRKSWNVYSVFLTEAEADDSETNALLSIEEDFRATRKIARSGLSTERDVEDALASLLPIRHRISLTPVDATARAVDSLRSLLSDEAMNALRKGSSETLVEALLRGEKGG